MAAEDASEISLVSLSGAMADSAEVDDSSEDGRSLEVRDNVPVETEIDAEDHLEDTSADTEAELRSISGDYRRGLTRGSLVAANNKMAAAAARNQMPQRAKPSSFAALSTKSRLQAVQANDDVHEYEDDDDYYEYYDDYSSQLANQKPGSGGLANRKPAPVDMAYRYYGLTSPKAGRAGGRGTARFGTTNGKLGLGSRQHAIGGFPRHLATGFIDYGRQLGRIFDRLLKNLFSSLI
jgi:hypothetical protein